MENMVTAEDQHITRAEIFRSNVPMSSCGNDFPQPLLSGSITPLQDNGLMSPPPRPDSSASRAGNRLSLSLPIQAGVRDSPWLNGHELRQLDLSSTEALSSPAAENRTSNNSSNGFLVAIAGQERKVLELKEELYRAESQLKKLKREWALYEASRNTVRSSIENRRHEVRQFHPTVMHNDSTNGGEDEDRSRRRSLNMHADRRKAMLEGSTRDSRRKVITGGHTRALSLLSPVQSLHGQTESLSKSVSSKARHDADGISLPVMTNIPSKMDSNQARHSYQGNSIVGVKQIAEDIKTGLWTFMEDLRQATVGEEAVKETSSMSADLTPRRSSKRITKGTPLNKGQGLSRSPRERTLAFRTREQGRSEIPVDLQDSRGDDKVITQTPSAPKTNIETVNSLDDDWSNWDSPISKEESGRWSNSTAVSSRDASNGSSPPTELKGLHSTVSSKLDSKDDVAVWPALNNFTPSNIKRTASAIMKEWEKNLIPSSRQDELLHLTSGVPKLAKKIMDEESRLLLNNLP